jgi:hypothetical protein
MSSRCAAIRNHVPLHLIAPDARAVQRLASL